MSDAHWSSTTERRRNDEIDRASACLAQQNSVPRYIDANPGRVLAELTEIESGRSKDRPQLKRGAQVMPRLYRQVDHRPSGSTGAKRRDDREPFGK